MSLSVQTERARTISRWTPWAVILGITGVSAAHPGDGPSYVADVLPLLQARCHGCHQPAKAGGDVILTSHSDLLLGLEDAPLVVPGGPDESLLVQVLESWQGEPPEMPKEAPPLTVEEVGVLRAWIEAGAVNDAPLDQVETPTAENPPLYSVPPVLTSLAFSPDGELLAVSGRHEVLLHRADGEGLIARFVGLSERVESLAFSPDGKMLAVVGGSPARMGEVQLWDVDSRELQRSVTVGFDTLRGVSWSHDGKRVAFGCTDNSVRAIEVSSGEQVLYQGAHEDWVLGTSFSSDDSHLISVSRDRTMKLILIETQQFIDNITSITPGALKGGLMSVARHPSRDEVLVGGADGTPKVYMVYREKKRVIGDDYNLVRAYGALPGRVFAVAWAPDGESVYAGASTHGSGEVRAFATSGEERWRQETPGGVFSLAVSPSGERVAAGGFDGSVRLFRAVDGDLANSFLPVPIENEEQP